MKNLARKVYTYFDTTKVLDKMICIFIWNDILISISRPIFTEKTTNITTAETMKNSTDTNSVTKRPTQAPGNVIESYNVTKCYKIF